jgi:predicted tellurium resistance membrane protein TerC
MARFGILSGLLLCIDTAIALFGSTDKAPLLFIPMMLGIPIMFFGVVALNPHRRRQALATAAAIGVLGCAIGAGELLHLFSLWRDDGMVNLHNARIVSLMIAVCFGFLIGHVWTALTAKKLPLNRSTPVN